MYNIFDESREHNVVVKDKILETDINSSAEQQLLYNMTVQSVLGNVVRFHASEKEEMIVLRVEYDDFRTTHKVEFSFRDKELFFKFFRTI